MAKQKGLKAYIVRSGQHKGVGSVGVPVTPENVAQQQKMCDAFAAQFVAAVNRGRRLSLTVGDEVADGRVFVGAEARRVGLIDGVTSFDKLLAKLQAFQPAR
jgi:protease-4